MRWRDAPIFLCLTAPIALGNFNLLFQQKGAL